MHELAICQSLLEQVEQVAQENGAVSVTAIRLQVGPLSGVEVPLLENAWPIAAAGSIAEAAELLIENTSLRVYCETCGKESDASLNKLVCGECGDFHTRLLSGDEMMLMQVELETRMH